MHVEDGITLHGISAASLKALLKRHHSGFTTVDAMAALDLHEPKATDVLLALAREGYIDYAGRNDMVDRWTRGDVGQRLVATRIGKRFPAREGRGIASKVVEAAKVANADPASPLRITWIALFGSVLDSGDDALVGDVDLMIRIQSRSLPRPEIKKLRAAQLASAPRSYHDHWSPDWSDVLMRRRLKAVSARVSIMDASSTLDLGVRHRALYAYDLETEAEVPVSGETETSDVAAQEEGTRGAGPTWEGDEARPWPTPPGARPRWMGRGRDHLGNAAHLTAQHMWRCGASLKDISDRLYVPEWTIRLYLSAQDRRPTTSRTVAPTMVATVRANLPSDVVVEECGAKWGVGRSSGVTLTLSDGRGTCRGLMPGAGIDLWGDMSLAPIVEVGCMAGERWRLAAARHLSGMSVEYRMIRTDARRACCLPRAVPDFTSLRSTCDTWMRRSGPVDVGFGPCSRRMSVTLGMPDGAKVENLWDDEDSTRDADVMAEVRTMHEAIVGTGASWSVHFTA